MKVIGYVILFASFLLLSANDVFSQTLPATRPTGDTSRILIPVSLKAPSTTAGISWDSVEVKASLELWHPAPPKERRLGEELLPPEGRQTSELVINRSLAAVVKSSGLCIVGIRRPSLDDRDWRLRVKVRRSPTFPYEGELYVPLSASTAEAIAAEGLVLPLQAVQLRAQVFQVLREDGSPSPNTAVRLLQAVGGGRVDVVREVRTDGEGKFSLDVWNDTQLELEISSDESGIVRYPLTKVDAKALAIAEPVWKIAALQTSLVGSLVAEDGVAFEASARLWYRRDVKEDTKGSPVDREKQFLESNASYVKVVKGRFAIHGLESGQRYYFWLDGDQRKQYEIIEGKYLEFSGKPIAAYKIVVRPIVSK